MRRRGLHRAELYWMAAWCAAAFLSLVIHP